MKIFVGTDAHIGVFKNILYIKNRLKRAYIVWQPAFLNI